MNNAERIGNLMFRYMRKELSRKEMAELDTWRKHSPKNESAFQDTLDPEKMWEDLKALDESRDKRQKIMLEKALTSPLKRKSSPRSRIRRIGFGILKIAATILVVFVTFIGVSIYRFKNAHSHPSPDSEDHLAAMIDFSDLIDNTSFNRGILAGFARIDVREEANGWFIARVPDTSRQAKNVYFRLFTTEGNRLLLNFSDSTQIWLNSNATIKYPAWQLSDSIRIYLSGEAYVHIPQGTKHVYEVKISPPVDSTEPSAFREAIADKTSRSIYLFSTGGDFYLKAYFNNTATMATLISGSLRIDSVAGKSVTPVNLEPGQQAKLDSGKLEILKPERINDLFLWKRR